MKSDLWICYAMCEDVYSAHISTGQIQLLIKIEFSLIYWNPIFQIPYVYMH